MIDRQTKLKEKLNPHSSKLNDSEIGDEDKVDVDSFNESEIKSKISDFNKCALQIAINQIALEISSPMAKILAYKEQIEYIIPEYSELEADA